MNLTNTGNLELRSSVSNADRFTVAPYNSGAGTYTGTLTTADLTADRTWTLPDTAGTIGLASNDLWQLGTQGLAPGNTTLDLYVGGTATSGAEFHASALEAAAGGLVDITSSAITTGNVVDLTSSALTSGILMNIQATSTALTSGKLLSLDWSPTSYATASGDLFSLNLGAYGDLTGNLFNITDNGSSLFSVSTSKITNNLPTEFTAAGDVSFAYDIQMTNQTSSNIQTYGPFTIEVGENFENNDLTLKTYGSLIILSKSNLQAQHLVKLFGNGMFGIILYKILILQKIIMVLLEITLN